MGRPRMQQEAACPSALADSTATRVLVYCLQDSGCTLFALGLAQLSPETFVLPDLWITSRAPCPQDFRIKHRTGNGSIIAKMTVRGLIARGATPVKAALERLSVIRRSFQPHMVIFFARDPWVQFARLSSKPFSNELGTPEAKLQVWDALFARRNDLANSTHHFHELCHPAGVAALASRLIALGLARSEHADVVRRLTHFWRTPATVTKDIANGMNRLITVQWGWKWLHWSMQGLEGASANATGLGVCNAKIESDWRTYQAVHSEAHRGRWDVWRLAPASAEFYSDVRRRWTEGTLYR